MGAGRPKGSGGPNKSAEIREYLSSNPDATTNEVVDALAAKGIDVSQALVAGVRARSNGSTKKRKITKGEVTVKELNSVHSVVENFEDADDARNMIGMICTLVEEIGSVDRLNEVLKAYEDWTPSEEGSSVETMESEDSVEASDSDSDSDYDDDDDDDEDDD